MPLLPPIIAPPLVTSTVAYDATGGGATGSGTSASINWTHALGSSATALLVGIGVKTLLNDTYAESTRTVQVGATNLNQLNIGYLATASSNQWVELWGLVGPSVTAIAGTTPTITVAESFNADIFYLNACSVSYSGVGSFSTHLTQGTSVTMTTGALGSHISYMMASVSANYGSFSQPTWASPSGTQRYYVAGSSGSTLAVLIQDAAGSSSGVTFTATNAGGGFDWGTITADLIPIYSC